MTETVSQPAVIDLEILLTPISDDAPSGELMQYSGLYDEIREARRADDTLSRGAWSQDLKVADWRKVVELSVGALRSQTKDLQIGAWLTEGLTKQHGFAGLRDSLRLLHGLHENFWETVFPEIDEGNDMEARANALEFMDRQTALAVKEIPLTANGLHFLNWEDSKLFDIPENLDQLDSGEQEKYRALQAQAAEENRTTGDAWRKGKNSARRAYYETMWATVEECWTAFGELDRKMDECFGNQTPGLGQLKKSLDAVRDLVKRLVEEKRKAEPTEEELASASAGDFGGAADENGYEGNGNGTGAMYAVAGAAGTTGPIRSRQDALKRLSEVADFFRQTEPHSPVSHLVQRAVKWGNMPLESWLQDVIKDGNVLEQIRETLGLNTYSDSSE
jgi:type VI secretion system protein ImpA